MGVSGDYQMLTYARGYGHQTICVHLRHLRMLLSFCVACAPTIAHALPADRLTAWDPGIPGGIPQVMTVHATLDAARYGNGTSDATAAVNAAIQSAGDAARADRPLVVYLPAGTWRITGAIALNRSHVVLRGAGPHLTRVRYDSTEESFAVGMGLFWPDYGPPVDVVGSVPKGARTLTVADASGIEPGDVLQIDQLDDPGYVRMGDWIYGKRGPRDADANGPGSPEGYRSVGQQIGIVGKQGNTLTLAGPTHIAFDQRFRPQVFHTGTDRPGCHGRQWIGLEDLWLGGGRNNNIQILNLAYGWVRNVELNGNPAERGGLDGDHINLFHAWRCEIRGCYVHHARHIVPGGGAYGIDIANQSSDNLVEDNIVRQLNKPILTVASGGGNVVAYNFVDDAYIATHDSWQENGIDGCHGSFSHHDLFEGNDTPNIGSDSTHGNCGWQTFFRNHARGVNLGVPRSACVRAVGVDGYNREHTFAGNVLLSPGLTVGGRPPVYLSTTVETFDLAAAFRVGGASLGGEYHDLDDGTALRLLLAHGNFDYATGRVNWDPRLPERDLPASLYLRAKPAWWSDAPWPYVDPLREPKVGILPARARFEAMARR